MKKLESLYKFQISQIEKPFCMGGARIKTYTDCSSYTYNSNNEMCDSNTIRTNDDGSKSGWSTNDCSA